MSSPPPQAPPPRCIGVVGHPRYTTLHSVVHEALEYGRSHGIEFVIQPGLLPPVTGATTLDADSLPRVQLLLTLGGDGTLLTGARMVVPHGVPVLGVNLGHLGFLTSIAPEGLPAALEAVAAGDVLIDERMVLQVRAESGDGTVHSSRLALNDAVLHRGGVARMIRMAVQAHGEEVGTYSADGIILSTPTGSTAYSLSAGGPIVAPTVDCILATPICPHTLAVRPLVLSAAETVTVEVLSPSEELILTIDGQESASLVPGDRVVVERAPQRLRLVRLPDQTYFSTLRRKLRWGDLEERER